MNKTYDHKIVEQGLDQKWQEKGYFMTHDVKKKPFSILLPPPNVTGKLHLGHALDSYIPDTIIRYKKLMGYDVLWLPGMDHAGIATQSKVESELVKNEGLNRHDLGREKFLEKIWEWKDEYAGLFRKQWSKLGLALDYQFERFTLDQKANEAVLKVFVDLYNKGFIYKGVRAINWDIQLQTALSNIEVNNEPTEQKMYYIKYPIKDSNQHLTIATVRTETLLSDVAIVHAPNDSRYLDLDGKFAIHPITKRELPIISDEYVDPEFGTGLMKLSAHAEADIEIIQKLGYEIIETIDKNGFINAPDSIFHGLERFAAREAIGNYLAQNGFIEKVETTISNVAVSDRSKTVVETLVLPQWFVKMDHFRDLILDNLNSEDSVKFFPKRFKATLEQWMDKVHDWTISRQLWWGHRIPAWYDSEGNIKVQIESPGEGWVQDPDVLDTWFSSGIAPFTFLDWPNTNPNLERYYPYSLLVTGYDIIFFWVARMYFFGLEFMQEKPFDNLLLHGLIRDSQGRKMSKSLNNGVDPMDMIDLYGSDSLRWFLITNTTPGLDIRFSSDKVESAWRVINKLWNIAKYINDMPEEGTSELTLVDHWILNKLDQLTSKIHNSMETYDFAVIGTEIYRYIFNELSGWYVELLKTHPSKQGALLVLRKTLIVLHPFMPFVTDRIFSSVFNEELLEQDWPAIASQIDTSSIDNIIEVVTELRKYREDNKISKKETLFYYLEKEIDQTTINAINRLAFSELKENKDYLITLTNNNLYVLIDEAQKEQNKKLLLEKIEFVKSEIARASKILSNANFIQKAPREKIEIEQTKLAKYEEDLEKYMEELKCKY
ncbi:valine--tRNA ligase [Mycoplasmopsis gallopavonis]|uniref:Valine--tRNA ligase n=1 Tax=Mycoplasmopsis gallopavonis TaxID=76629 RepID=A0A449AYS3_9BACT|nr:valine--tRNA ligase [Mycoplasmopsis gallopavonis]RIV16633.1 valine--tRNA ligase [Mycoplasmopsis gallopavonis]VEU72688.1 Valine--tRNA ligase [Mycoplasmopsis gallopavonis]